MLRAALATLYALNWLTIMKVIWEEARTELMKMIFLASDFFTRGRKARETRRGATALKIISSPKSSRSLRKNASRQQLFTDIISRRLQVLELGQGLGVLASVVDEVVETVGEKRGSSSDGSINAGLAVDIKAEDLEVLVLGSQRVEFGRILAGGGNDEVAVFLELG